MDKIKKIFSGHKEDDDTTYDSGNNTTSHTTGSHTTGSHTTGSNTTGSSTTGNQGYSLNDDPLYANSAAGNESGLKRQILNPGNDKYDDHRFNEGEIGSTNPSSTLGSSTLGSGSRPAATGNASTASIRSGVVGAEQQPPSLSTDNQAADYSSGNTTSLPDRTGTSTHDSHLGRDSTIAGGVGAATHRAEQGRHNDTIGNTDRSFPLGGGNTTGTHDSHLGRDAGIAGGVGAAGYEAEKHHHGHHHHGTTGTSSNLGGNTTGLGSNSNTTGGLLSGHQHEGHGHNFDGDPCPPGSEAPVPGYVHHVAGPHSTDIANVLDPHVPGGFPGESGQTGSHLGRDTAVAGGVGATGLGAYETEKHHHHHNTSSSQPLGGSSSTHDRDSHLGRDAGIAGGVGAADLGAHEAGKHHHHHHQNEAPFSGAGGFDDQRYDPSATSSTSHGLRSGDQSSSIGYPSSTSNPSGTTSGTSHAGRDAALAGGAGAAGLGAYESSRGNTGPASSTIGPHDSNLANVVDPRVQPNSSQMKDPNPNGPYHSDTLNKVDPRINPQAADSQKQHHYGRDAAFVGGAGALGAGAYEADKHHSGATGQNTSGYGSGNQSGYGSGNQSGYGSSTQSGYGSSNQPTSSQVNAHGASSGVAGADQSRDHHYGRDAALAGGAGAAGLGAYELGKDHDSSRLGAQSYQQPLATPTGAPRDARVFDQTQNVPESNQATAGWATDTKQQEKLAKQHDKELRKEEKHHEKALEKEEKREEKEAHKGEKKGGLLGFLHHDKTNDENVRSGNDYREADQAAHLRHQQQLERDAAAGTAGKAGVAGASFEPRDPRISTDERGHNRLHKDPSAKVQNELDQRAREQGSGLTGHDGSEIPESMIGSGQDAFVTDPHTGLKMNVGKYGRGTGGTDGGPIPGYQSHN